MQRFGSAANLNTCLYCLFLDSICPITDIGPVFQPVRAPTTEQLHTLLNQIINNHEVVDTHGLLIEKEGMSYMAEIDEAFLSRFQDKLVLG